MYHCGECKRGFRTVREKAEHSCAPEEPAAADGSAAEQVKTFIVIFSLFWFESAEQNVEKFSGFDSLSIFHLSLEDSDKLLFQWNIYNYQGEEDFTFSAHPHN